MRAIKEVLGRFFKEDPRKKERADLASQFRERMERLLGGLEQREFDLDGVQIAEVSRHTWERPATIKISREPYGFRFALTTDMTGKAFELHGIRPRIFETSQIGGYSGYTPTEGNPLDQEIGWFEEWIGIVSRLEELRKNPQTVSSAPVAP